jgi:hypothetical protein
MDRRHSEKREAAHRYSKQLIDFIFDGVIEEINGRSSLPPIEPPEKLPKPSLNSVYSHMIVVLNTIDEDKRAGMLKDLAYHFGLDENAVPSTTKLSSSVLD